MQDVITELGVILTRAMDEERMEEDSVSLLHVKVNPLSVLHAFDAVVHLVHAAFPVRVVVSQEVVLERQFFTLVPRVLI